MGVLANMRDIQKMLDVIVDYIYDKDDVIFLDYPLHHNVGDSLILLGNIEFFNYHNINVKKYYTADSYSISEIANNITKNTTILFHGGGNFGDLYPKHQKFRETVVDNFKDNRIIVLPQTAHFNSTLEKDKSKKIFNSHKNLILCARDQSTFELFNEFAEKVLLLPDMAHCLYGTLPKNKKTKHTLYFLRKDIEKIDNELLISETSIDWNDLISIFDSKLKNLLLKILSFKKVYNFNLIDKLVFWIWVFHIRKISNNAAILFSSHDVVITSRLHGHILSCLVDTPSEIIDNSYGKNLSYYNQWTKSLDLAKEYEEV